MHRTIGIILLQCAAVLGQATGGAPRKSANINSLCFADGLKYTTIQAAITACGAGGTVVVAPSFPETDSFTNPGGVALFDFRRHQHPDGLTPVTDLGAKGDAVTGGDGASQSGSSTFSSASGSFVSGRDVGKAIVITGAGPENASLTTTITGVSSPTQVTLATAAGFTAKGLTYWYGTENTAAMQSAYRAQKPLFLPPGKYLMTGTVKGSLPLFLTGSGAESVLIDDTAVFDVHGTRGHLIDNLRMQSATKLTAVRPNAFPTPNPGTPVAVDRIGAGIGYEPASGDNDIWAKVSKQQRDQRIGPTITISSDQTHIYRITGDLVSLILFDVQYSEVSMCDFRAGRNFVGGIALWHTPKDGLMNRHDSIHHNIVRYASFSGIVWAASERVYINHNVSENNGESGLKNYSSQGDGTYNSNAQVIENRSQHNHYDGLDLSETYPHSNKQQTSSVVSGNISSFNDRTGAFGDGMGWTITSNVFERNGLTGMSLDVSNSTISGNTLLHNNALHEANAHQILLAPGIPSMNNVIERNRIEAESAAGFAIVWSRQSTGNRVRENTATGGAVFSFGEPPVEARGNSDSRGRYADR
jgi:hypothetical protein